MNLYSFVQNDGVNVSDALGNRITLTRRTEEDGTLVVEIAATIQVIGCPPPESADKDLLRRDLMDIWTDEISGAVTIHHPDGRLEKVDVQGRIRLVSVDIKYIEDPADTDALEPDRHTFRLVDKSGGFDGVTFRHERSHVPGLGSSEAEIFKESHKRWRTYSHEFGHWLALEDRYTTEEYIDIHGGGLRVRSKPLPEWKNHIMGDGGTEVHPLELYQLRHFGTPATINKGLPRSR